MENKEVLAQNGITNERFDKHPDDFDKMHQLTVLVTDLDCEAWTRSHFALYLTVYPQGTPWGDALRSLYMMFREKDSEAFLLMVESLRKALKEHDGRDIC